MVQDSRPLGGLAAAALVLLLAGKCDPPPVDPSRAKTVEEQCWHACEHLRHLACPGFDGQPSETATCEETCIRTEQGDTARFCPVELTYARNCSELEQQWEACE